jgi:hypothetical protein
VVIPNSVTSIGEYAFEDCLSLTSVVIPDSVTSIGASAFSGYSSLTIYCEASSKPSGWDSDWNYHSRPVVWGITGYGTTEDGFGWASKDNAVTIIGYTGSATAIAIPETINGMSVTSIGSYAFCNCSSLTSITIPDSVTRIGEDAFDWCYNLTDIYYGGSEEAWQTLANRPDATYVHYNCDTSIRNLTTPTVTIANAATGVKVSWNKVTGASSYKVYRKTGSGSWVEIKSGLTGTSYTDTTAKKGTTYYYTVRAVKGTQLSSYKSSSSVKRTK